MRKKARRQRERLIDSLPDGAVGGFVLIVFQVGLLAAIQFHTEPRTTLTARLLATSDLTSADSGLQLNLEIALSGVSAKIQSAFQVRPKVR
jgi:hypothetical protein